MTHYCKELQITSRTFCHFYFLLSCTFWVEHQTKKFIFSKSVCPAIFPTFAHHFDYSLFAVYMYFFLLLFMLLPSHSWFIKSLIYLFIQCLHISLNLLSFFKKRKICLNTHHKTSIKIFCVQIVNKNQMTKLR